VRSNFVIKPATPDLAFKTAPYLRWQDQRELKSSGYHPILGLVLSVEASDAPIVFYTPKGDIAGFAGVCKDESNHGVVWMLCTPAVEEMPILFCKDARKWINAQADYQLLYNVADPRNYLHMRFLKHLGFKRLGYQHVGPRATTFVEFAKIMPCASL
jgi:hypothetical protein